MHPAVEGMVYEYNTAYICFVLGLIAFHFSAALFAWLMFTWCAAARSSQRRRANLSTATLCARRPSAELRPSVSVPLGRWAEGSGRLAGW